MIDRLPEPEVKFGNLVDPVKIAAKKTEAKSEQIGKMALNPLYGRICAAVLIGENITNKKVIASDSDLNEADIILEVFSIIGKGVQLVTWNGKEFDLPFIYKRAIMLGLTSKITLPLSLMTSRYDDTYHIDLMQSWAGYGQYAKLDDVSGAVLDNKKIEIDVTKFPELIKSEAGRVKLLEYCEKDVRLTFDLYKRFKGVLFE